MIRVTDNHAARLQRMLPSKVMPALGHALEAGAHAIAEDAIASILDGAISGPGHVASLPGEPPNADTHDLDRSIYVGEVIETPGEVKTAVISDSDHAWIERGGANMEPRPHIEPATERNRPEVLDGAHRALKRQVGLK